MVLEDPIEDTQLLRRQMARRCIFGVDMNPMAVELARLSLWIHTFVPGLPLSLLDHNLVRGNSLVGIATFDEASELMGPRAATSSPSRLASDSRPSVSPSRSWPGSRMRTMPRYGRHGNSTSRCGRETQRETELFTVLTASRTNGEIRKAIEQGNVATRPEGQEEALPARLVEKGKDELKGLSVLHFHSPFPTCSSDRGRVST